MANCKFPKPAELFRNYFRSNSIQLIDFTADNYSLSYSANLLLSSNIFRNYISREFVAGFGDMITGQFFALSPIDEDLDLFLGRWDGKEWVSIYSSRNPGNVRIHLVHIPYEGSLSIAHFAFDCTFSKSRLEIFVFPSF
jgi:hypothetical protein